VGVAIQPCEEVVWVGGGRGDEEARCCREKGGEGHGEVGWVKAQEHVESDDPRRGTRDEPGHALDEANDDVGEDARDHAVGEVTDAVAGQSQVREQQLVGPARGTSA
jgi:hypothetical protein